MSHISLPVDRRFSWKRLIVPMATAAIFWTLAIVLFVISEGQIFALLNFGYLGTALGIGLGLYAILPRKQKPLGRRISLLMIGLYLFFFVGLLGRENIQIEGVWWSILNGTFYAAVWHYMVAKVAGPLLFGRLWCGWACWSVMIFDLLPYKRSAGRLPRRWGWLRYGHVALSILLVVGLWQLTGLQVEVLGQNAVVWFIAGNALYYALGIGMAVMLKDNRAFCKYLCPVAVPLKLTSRFSLLKVGTVAEKCNECGACEKVCPMDVRLTDYIRADSRVLSTECTLCQTCVTVCHRDALKLSLGLDAGGREALRYQSVDTTTARQQV